MTLSTGAGPGPGARNRKRATGAILMGGRSSRMGAPKHAVELSDGRTMVQHVCDAMSRVCDRIVIVGARAKGGGLQSVGFDVAFINDLRPDQGPLGGIEAILSCGLDEQYLVCPCDVPRVTPEVLATLLERSDAPSAILRVRGEEARPLPARISVDALPAVRRLLDEGRRAVYALHEEIGPHVIEVPEEWRDLLANVNTPEELEEINRR